MVLILMLTVLLNISGLTNDSLTEKYFNQIEKCITKTFNSEKLKLTQTSFSSGELSKVTLDDKHYGFVLIAEVAACNLGGCSSTNAVAASKGNEFFDLLVVLNADFQIKKILILDYFSDYGYEITSKNYLKKFLDKEVCSFAQKTDEVDAISGATVSSYALESILASLCGA